MTSVAIISDTHGLVDARVESVVNRCDIVVHAGDIGNADVLRNLEPLSGQIKAVRGNNDTERQWPENDLECLAKIPWQNELALPGGTLVLVHGHRATPAKDRHQLLRRQFPHARAVAYGHSHHMVVDQSQGPWILNPGASGHERTHGGPSCLVLQATEQQWLIEQYRFPFK